MMNEQCKTLIIDDSAVELLKANDRLQRELFERERAERAARVSQALLSSIIDGTTDQIAALDLKLRFIAFNKAYKAEFLKIFGREIEIGASLIDALAHLPQEQAKVVDLWSRALRGEEFTVIQERSASTRERSYYKIKYNCIRDENNQIIGASLVIRDSSDRLGTEAALLKSEERLQLALLSSGDGLWEEKLKLLNAQLEESNQELQNFAFIASHDLKEPLRTITSFSRLLSCRYEQLLDERGRDYIQRMQKSAQRMQGLIDDLLALSRVTTQAQPFVFVDLNQVVQNVLSSLETRIQETKAQIEVGLLPTIEAESGQIHQLMQNLISNALKFHGQNSPVVKIYSQTPVIDSVCQIFVEDQGIGFDEKYLDRIFQIFERLHGRSEYEGTGIGLALCRKITERHGGSITAKSLPGQGSTFIVTLPMKGVTIIRNS